MILWKWETPSGADRRSGYASGRSCNVPRGTSVGPTQKHAERLQRSYGVRRGCRYSEAHEPAPPPYDSRFRQRKPGIDPVLETTEEDCARLLHGASCAERRLASVGPLLVSLMSTPAPRPIRVLHLITDLDSGGAEMMLARLVSAHDRARVDPIVISLSGRGSIAEQIEKADVPVYAVGMRGNTVSARSWWQLVRLLRRLKPDIVQTWLYHADFAGLLAGSMAGVPRIVWNIRCAELDVGDVPARLLILRRVLSWLSPLPAGVVCNSQAGCRAHERLGYRPRGWSIIPNGFDTEAFQPSNTAPRDFRAELGLSSGTPLVGMLARLHPMKDHATFVRSAAIVAAQMPHVHFVAVGRGVPDDPRILALVRELGLSGCMHLLGERQDTPRILAGLDVAVLSSYSEAFPNALGEAMACGTPCVSTDVGDAAAILGSAGVLVPARNPGALAEGVLHLIRSDESTRQALGRAGRERIVATYSLRRAAEQYEGLYTQLTHGSANPRQRPARAG
jgi:glycosyltransferase involved in cell wall biosynthesis